MSPLSRGRKGRRRSNPLGGPTHSAPGIWGYADLEEVLADPAHPDHEDKLDWLGLDDAAQFDPTDFDAEKVTQALARLARLP